MKKYLLPLLIIFPLFCFCQPNYIKKIAGVSTYGFSGDGGLATSASLNTVWGVTSDTAGNVYILDNGNNRVRKVSRDGFIHTIAGNGTYSTSIPDGVPATSVPLSIDPGVSAFAVDNVGNLYFGVTGNKVKKRHL